MTFFKLHIYCVQYIVHFLTTTCVCQLAVLIYELRYIRARHIISLWDMHAQKLCTQRSPHALAAPHTQHYIHTYMRRMHILRLNYKSFGYGGVYKSKRKCESFLIISARTQRDAYCVCVVSVCIVYLHMEIVSKVKNESNMEY